METLTYDVPLKFPDRKLNKLARAKLQSLLDRSLDILNTKVVWYRALWVTSPHFVPQLKALRNQKLLIKRRKGQSISGTMFKASVLRNELKGVIPNHAANLNESVYLHALSTAAGHRHRLTIARTVVKQLTPLRYTELLLFGQTDKLISVIVDQFNYSWLGAKVVLKGMAKRMQQLSPVTITSSVTLPDPKDFANALHQEGLINSHHAQHKLQRLLMLANSVEFAGHLQWWLQQASSGNDCWKLTKKLSKRLGIHSKDRLFMRLLKHYLAYLLLRPSVPKFRAGDLITTPVYKRTTIWLVMGSKYVIKRPGNASTIRQMILDGKDIELHFGYKYKIPVKGLLKVHHKMRQILKTGDLRCIALSINPKNNLIRAQLIVDRTDFRIHLRKLKVPKAKVVGIDLNKIGKHIVAFSIPYTDPGLNKLCAKYWQYKDLIRELQSKLDRQRRPNPRLHEQIRQLHRKRKDIRRAIHNMLVPLIASVVASSGAETLVMERLHMKPHGLKKGLAEAVNSMPKTGLQLRLKQALPNVEIVSIDPWKPAFKIHANCGGKLDRKKNWHYPPCSKCKAEVNSHENAAKMLVKYYLSSSTIQQFLSSLTGRKS